MVEVYTSVLNFFGVRHEGVKLSPVGHVAYAYMYIAPLSVIWQKYDLKTRLSHTLRLI